MKAGGLDREMALEVGLGLFAFGLLAGVAVLILGKAAGGAQHGRQRARGAPERGSMPQERNRNIGTVAAR